MDVYKVIFFFAVLVLTTTKTQATEQNVSDTVLTGVEYQMLAARLEVLQYKIITMDMAMAKDRELIYKKLSVLNGAVGQLGQTMEQKLTEQMTQSSAVMQEDLKSIHLELTGITGAINQLHQTIGQNLSTIQTQSSMAIKNVQENIDLQRSQFTALKVQSDAMFTQKTAHIQHDRLRKDIQQLASKNDLAWFAIDPYVYLRNFSVSSCKSIATGSTIDPPSGKYIIQPTPKGEPFPAYCEQNVLGGGWLVFQYRYDGSVDFYRNWTEYRNGFGSLDGEFWLGLKYLHRLTSARPHELLVELSDFNGSYKYALYDKFEIGSESEQYALKQLGSYTGTAGDSLDYHRNEKFTTMDRDNDAWSSGNCATSYKGAWWYSVCAHSNLNGVYMNRDEKQSMHWLNYQNSRLGVAYSRMMIREI